MSLFQRLAPVSARLMQNSFPAAIPYNQTRGMANLKDLKTRMKSIASVKKITASMKTVATSKLKAAELRKEIALPLYSSSFQALEGHIESSAAKEGDKNLVIVVTSDRGLCGSVNSSVTRYIKAQAKQTKTASTDLIILGEKGRAGLIRDFYKDMSLFATELDKKPVNFADVLPIAEEILKKNFDVASIVSNKFISILTFETRERNFLSQERMLAQADLSEYELEPEDALEDLYSFHVATLLFSSIVENQACELGARMTSMDNATRNAGDMLNKITLEYNKRRQASITTELVEIISGAQSMQDAAAE